MNELRNKYKDCKPNSAHKAIADLEKDYDVTVITQNIDNLHELAGSSKVIHLHGDLSKVRAIGTSYEVLFDYPEEGITPASEINGFKVRPHIVLFGEDVPNITKAIPIVEQADICVVIGTSFNVYPAADLVSYVDNPIYYIDPSPAYTPDYPDIKIIKATATKGMKQFLKTLNNGEQHYRPVEKFGGKETYEKQVVRDNLLKEYCSLNKIQLIEIKYNIKFSEIEQFLIIKLNLNE